MGVVRMSDRERRVMRRWVLGSTVAFCLAAVLLPFVGPFPLDLRRVLTRAGPDWPILIDLRLSRTLLGLFAGGALSLAGCVFQAMLRDALATPYTLGVSAGASLGAVLVIWAGWQTLGGVPAIWLGALAGAGCVLVLVVGAAGPRRISSFSLLLTGIATNSVCSAFIILIYGLAGVSQSFSISRWLIGSLDSTGYAPLTIFVVGVVAIAVVVIRQAKDWNLLAVDESWAAARGARVPRLMLTGYAAGSVLTAGTIALTGPIGFVGLIVPHIVRSRVSADHRVLMPCAFLLGGVMLAACDAIGRFVLTPSEVPAGAIMAIVGGPYLIWIVRQRGVTS
jgi:iron complex transport system permease protein